MFYLLTKRPERVVECLPEGWGQGWDNVWFNVACGGENYGGARPCHYDWVLALHGEC